MTQPEIQRLLRHVTIPVVGDCWFWQGSLNKWGYPRVWFRGKAQQAAHRVMYVLFGGEIPEGFDLHHTCESRTCINPAHLVPKSRQDHRHEHLVEQCPQGHPYSESNTLMVSQGAGRPKKRRCRLCAKEYMARYHQNLKKDH